MPLFSSINNKNKNNSSNHNNNNSNNTTTTTPVAYSSAQQRALDIPELIERILSFLTFHDQQDTARLVCKLWHAICKDRVPASYTWRLPLVRKNRLYVKDDSDIDINQAKEVALAHSIIIQADSNVLPNSISGQRLASWRKLMRILSHVVRDQKNQQQDLNLQTLYLREGVLEELDIQLPQLPRLATLKLLRIDVIVRWDIIHLFTILRACPNLEELFVRPTPAAAAPCRTTSLSSWQDALITSSREQAIISGDQALPLLTRLRTCALYELTVSYPALEAFLLASPRLSKLILVRCRHVVRYGQDTSSFDSSESHLEHVPSIIRLISTHCPDLKTFHFSVSRHSVPELSKCEVLTIAESFQHTEELNLLDKDFEPSLVKELSTAVVNRITTLNLLPSYSSTIPKSEIPLRTILCTFEHLVHFRAPMAAYCVDEMDLHDVQEQLRDHWNPKSKRASHRMDRLNARIPSDDPIAARQYVWACRGLRTLHMGVTCRDSDANFEELSLIMFGFLSRMCPRLQDLQLRMWGATLTLSGGLSLLTRLQDLEHVVIAIDQCPMMKEDNLFWLGSTQLSTLGRLGYPLLRHKALQKHRQRFRVLPPAKVTTAGSELVERGRELGMDLSKVGYPEDLMEWMDEYYGPPSSSSTLPLPKLRTFWIECSELRRDGIVDKLRAFVDKIRPEVDIRLCTIPQDVYYTATVKYF